MLGSLVWKGTIYIINSDKVLFHVSTEEDKTNYNACKLHIQNIKEHEGHPPGSFYLICKWI